MGADCPHKIGTKMVMSELLQADGTQLKVAFEKS